MALKKKRLRFKEGQSLWVKGVVDGYGDVYFKDTDGGRVRCLPVDYLQPVNVRTDDKVIIPMFVAEWVDYCKARDLLLWGAFDPVGQFGESLSEGFKGDLRKSLDWIKLNQNTFARAWLDGFKVEVPKLYTVEIPDPNSQNKYRFLKRGDNGVIICTGNDDCWKELDSSKLTESEIKEDFAWAWEQKFYKEVE